MRPSKAIVIGAGVGGLLTALLLARKKWSVRLFDDSKGAPALFELPYVCSNLVSDFLKTKAPDVLSTLEEAGARQISIAEILRSRFPSFVVEPRDEKTSFLCCSRSLLQKVLLEKVKAEGIEIVANRVDALVRHGNVVRGVECAGQNFEASLVIDATGSLSPRQKWLEKLDLPRESFEIHGPGYVSLAKFFRKTSNTPPVQFALASGRNFRGGIYPLENDRFAIALVVPQTTEISSPERFFASALDVIPGAPTWLENATPWEKGLQVLHGIQNRASDYYDTPRISRELQGFIPIGDSILSGNPIYGRGISFIVAQLEALLEGLETHADWNEVHKRVARGLRRARRYWADGAFADRADEAPDNLSLKALRFLRDTYVTTVISQLPRDPELTRRFLYNYQLMLPAWRITGPRQYWTALRKFSAMTR